MKEEGDLKSVIVHTIENINYFIRNVDSSEDAVKVKIDELLSQVKKEKRSVFGKRIREKIYLRLIYINQEISNVPTRIAELEKAEENVGQSRHLSDEEKILKIQSIKSRKNKLAKIPKDLIIERTELTEHKDRDDSYLSYRYVNDHSELEYAKKQLSILHPDLDVFYNLEKRFKQVIEKRRIEPQELYPFTGLNRHYDINYLFPYYPRCYSNNFTSAAIRLKNQDIDTILWYIDELVKFRVATRREYTLVTIPPSDCNKPLSGITGLAKVVANMYDNFIDGSDCLLRHKSIEKQSRGGRRNPKNQLESISVNHKQLIMDKNIILLDDIATSGSSMHGCETILSNTGAKSIFKLAMGKTQWSN